MNWANEKLGNLLLESKILCNNPNPNRRIRVKLNVGGVEKRPLKNEIEDATKQFIRKAGQFIYGKQNLHKGAFGIIPEFLDGYESSADIPSFDIRQDCLPEWIFYYFKSGNRYQELEKIARGVGSKRIHPEQLYQIEILLPKIEIQKQIIRRIHQLENETDVLIKEIFQQSNFVPQLRQAFLREAMQGKLIPQNLNDEPASELLKRIKEEKARLIAESKLKKEKPLPEIKAEEIPFEIPLTWTWCRLGEITSLITDGKHGDCNNEKNSGYYFLSAKDVQNGKLIYEGARQITFNDFQEVHNRTNLGPDDICLVNTGATIGKTAIAQLDEKTQRTTFQKSVAVIKLIQPLVTSKYLESVLIFETPRLMKTSWGTAINNLLLGDLKLLCIPLPPFAEQQRIVSKLNQLMQFCNQLEQNINTTKEQTNLLLQTVLREALEPEGEIN
jgi:type I restriction enzyme, S subunit